MEKVYWLSRKRASLRAAQNASSAEARLAHYDALPPAIYSSGAFNAGKARSDG